MALIDTHCHLDLPPLYGRVDGVLARARATGVRQVVVPATEISSWGPITALGRRDGVHAALGLHPWWAEQALDAVVLRDRLSTSAAVAVGEIGLDFAIERFSRVRQLEVFEQQVAVGRALDLPLLIHCRGAFEEMLALLRPLAPVRGVVHAFSRGPALAHRFVELGLHVAFGGTLTRDGARRAHAAARALPAERLLLETDAPSIGLEGVPAHDVEPSHVVEIAAHLAALRGVTPDEIALKTTSNANELFDIA